MSKPLEDISVLEIGHILAGPFCTMILADLGARVIKIERPGHGDEARRLGPQVRGDSAYFMSVNRGKKSIAIDLRREEGQKLALALSQKVDVIVENFVPGTMERFKLDYARLKPLNPRLVYASISGFGQNGPYARNPALDTIVQAMGGIMSLTGEPNGPPIRPGASLGDSVAGLFAATAIQAALLERVRTGIGCYLDISMLDCQVTMMENAFARFFAGEMPVRMGSRHPAGVPFQAFATLDGYVVVAFLSDSPVLWNSFCTAIERAELASDPRFSTASARLQNQDTLLPLIEEAMRRRSSQEWIKELTKLEIPCGPVNSIEAVVNDPQVLHRGMITQIPHKTLGRWSVANTPFKFDGTPSQPQGSAPDLGEHTEEILREMLGVSPLEFARLKSIGAV